MLPLLAELFIEGLLLAKEWFQMSKLDARLEGIENSMTTLERDNRTIKADMLRVRNTVDCMANFQTMSLREDAMKLLNKVNSANASNADLVALFVASFGAHLTAFTFKGRRRQRLAFGVQTYRGFIASTQTPERIFQTLHKFGELTELTGGRIVTGCVSSQANIRATAVAIAAFFKLAELLGVKTCPISDTADNPSDVQVVVRFEGSYTLQDYANVLNDRSNRVEIVRLARKNVYILGPNGAGKSSWGNLISGEETFEVGTSNHTTMIPQPCDIESSCGFRIWDMPGMFDGSEEQTMMEDHTNHIVETNGYCSAVLFVFPGSVPANEGTGKILQYALDHFGDQVKQNFIAIVNEFWGQGLIRRETYAQMLYDYGYKVDANNIFVSNALKQPNSESLFIRQRLGKFKPKLVTKHREAYSLVMQGHNDLQAAVSNLYIHGKQELESLLRRGKIETVRHQTSGLKRHTTVPKDVILFRQHSKGYLMRKLGIGNNIVKEERSVLLKGPPLFITLVRAQMNQEYSTREVNLFLKHILSNRRHILIHTPESEHDYELRDATSMTDVDLQEILVQHLINQV